jgi:hypothetical protein
MGGVYFQILEMSGTEQNCLRAVFLWYMEADKMYI